MMIRHVNSNGLGKLLIVLLCAFCVCAFSLGPEKKTLLSDRKAVVSAVSVPAGSEYRLWPETAMGAVWVAIDSLELTSANSNLVLWHTIKPGQSGAVSNGSAVRFRNVSGRSCQLVLIDVKSSINRPLGQSTELEAGQTLEGASAANETLVVAISAVELEDIRNLEEDEGKDWKSDRPVLLKMKPGDARWIAAGMHRIRNLGREPAKFVEIEW